MTLRTEGIRPYTVELKPLPTALSAVPEAGAVGSIGLGAEIFQTKHMAWFGEGQYIDVNTPNNLTNRSKQANPSSPVPSEMHGYEWTAGARLYGTPEVSTWYGSLGVGYSDYAGTFNYQDTTIAAHTISILPTVAAGYRWMFDNNVLLRLGLDVASNQVKSRRADAESQTANAADGEHKVRNLERTPVLANLDFGVGYGF
jgi:hypothetical protein